MKKKIDINRFKIDLNRFQFRSDLRSIRIDLKSTGIDFLALKINRFKIDPNRFDFFFLINLLFYNFFHTKIDLKPFCQCRYRKKNPLFFFLSRFFDLSPFFLTTIIALLDLTSLFHHNLPSAITCPLLTDP